MKTSTSQDLFSVFEETRIRNMQIWTKIHEYTGHLILFKLFK